MSTSTAYALWPIRLAVAFIMIHEGIDKVQSPGFYIDLFGGWGVPLAPLALWLVVAAEIGGGTLLFLGLLTRITAAVHSTILLTAILLARVPGPVYDGWGFELGFLAGTVSLMLNGPGRPTLPGLLDRPGLDPEDRLLSAARSAIRRRRTSRPDRAIS